MHFLDLQSSYLLPYLLQNLFGLHTFGNKQSPAERWLIIIPFTGITELLLISSQIFVTEGENPIVTSLTWSWSYLHVPESTSGVGCCDSQERAPISGDTPDPLWTCRVSHSGSSWAAASPAQTPASHTSSCGTRIPWCCWMPRCSPDRKVEGWSSSSWCISPQTASLPLWSILTFRVSSGFCVVSLWSHDRPGPWRHLTRAKTSFNETIRRERVK